MHKLYAVEGQTLTLLRNPEPLEIEAVRQAMFELAASASEADGVMDLTRLHLVSSTTVGMVVAVHLRFEEAGRRLRVRISPQLLKLFELTMLTDTLCLEMLGKDGKFAAIGGK